MKNKNTPALTVDKIILRDLRQLLDESPAITSPECLKNSIMKSKFVAHFSKCLLTQTPDWCRRGFTQSKGCPSPEKFAEFAVSKYFDDAVDTIYSMRGDH